MTAPTKEQVNNVGIDLNNIELVANGAVDLGGDGVITMRLGEKVPTIARSVAQVTATPYSTWYALSQVTAYSSWYAQVLPEDTGTHIDPVTGLTVNNEGFYKGNQGIGWQRIGSSQAGLASEYASEAATYAASAYSTVRFRDTLAEAIADFLVGEYFTTTDTSVALRDKDGVLTGETNSEAWIRACKRVASSPYYEHLGEGSDPANKAEVAARAKIADLVSTDGGGMIGLLGGWTAQDSQTIVPLDIAYAGPGIDAYTHIQGRLNLAGTLAAAGANTVEVRIPPQRFRILTNSMLVIPEGVHVSGCGDASIIDVSGVNGLSAMIAIGTSGTWSRDFRIIGSGKGTQPTNGIGLSDAEIITRLTPTGCGLIYAGVTKGRIDRVTVEDCGGTTGVVPYNGIAGIYLTYGCVKCVVQYCDVDTCRNGINEDNFFGVDPRGNRIVDNWIDGCRFGAATDCSGAPTKTVIRGNDIANCQQSGIDLNKPNQVNVVDNFVDACGLENGNSGIWTYGSSAHPGFDVKIMGNTVTGCDGNGIKIGPHIYRPIMGLNITSGNAKHGRLIIGQIRYSVSVGNIDEGNDLSGAVYQRVDGSNVATTHVSVGNIELSNGQRGLYLDGAAEVTSVGDITKANGTSVANTYAGTSLNNGAILNTFVGLQSSNTSQNYGVSGIDTLSTGNIFVGGQVQAGATARFGFASYSQTWIGMGDGFSSIAGAPSGNWPFGFVQVNQGDRKIRVRFNNDTWWYAALTAE